MDSGKFSTNNVQISNINFPIASSTTDEQYRKILAKAIAQVNDYNPDIVLVSMGFDCYHKDPIAGMNLSKSIYAEIGQELSNFSKIGIILEGGYHIEDLGACFCNLVEGIQAL